MNPVNAARTPHPSAVNTTHAEHVSLDADALASLAARIRQWGRELGFDAVGISDTDLSEAEQALQAWLAAGFHGEMDYMAKHGLKRARPAELVPGTLRVISLRMAYLPAILPGLDDDTTAREAARQDDVQLSDDAPDRVSGTDTNRSTSRAAPSSHGTVEESDARAGASSEREKPRPDWRAAQFARYDQPGEAVVSVYARGRDYHKVLRNRLQKLAERIQAEIGPFGYRVFTDSAPVLEVALAVKARIGWRGKHTLLLERDAGSFFFLGEIFVDLPLPADADPMAATADRDALPGLTDTSLPERAVFPVSETERPPSDAARDTPQAVAVSTPSRNDEAASTSRRPTGHCGSCTRCIDVCPTGAIVAPYKVDARRCISYLTIELAGSIPEPLRPLIGNRIYGCDDCQLICPWNKFALPSQVDDFDARNNLDRATLLELWEWTAHEFEDRLAGTAIRRIGYERWVRNLAVGLGNALRATSDDAQRSGYIEALQRRADDPSPLIREHVEWALQQTTQ
ncbi:epoxyqueuosine reductase [Pararobbsia alpina]